MFEDTSRTGFKSRREHLGVWRNLAAHSADIREVVGSIPITPITRLCQIGNGNDCRSFVRRFNSCQTDREYL
jgi:hypothetical protein